MSSSFEIVVTAILASITSTSILGVILQDFVKRWINSKFDSEMEAIKSRNAENLAILNAELEGRREVWKRIAQARLEVFPDICEKIYRAKNGLAADISGYESATDKQVSLVEIGDRLSEHQKSFTEDCYKHRFLFSDKQFFLMHRYKSFIYAILVQTTQAKIDGDAIVNAKLIELASVFSSVSTDVIAELRADELLKRSTI